jgi:hypothetical protein
MTLSWDSGFILKPNKTRYCQPWKGESNNTKFPKKIFCKKKKEKTHVPRKPLEARERKERSDLSAIINCPKVKAENYQLPTTILMIETVN